MLYAEDNLMAPPLIVGAEQGAEAVKTRCPLPVGGDAVKTRNGRGDAGGGFPMFLILQVEVNLRIGNELVPTAYAVELSVLGKAFVFLVSVLDTVENGRKEIL